MARNKCPPGILCITPNLLILVGVICIGLVVFGYYIYNEKQPVKSVVVPRFSEPTVRSISQPMPPPVVVNVKGGDDRYTRAPEPTRNYYGLTQIATRGLPEDYQSMGVITTSSGEILPLYGRRVASRSDRFNYYTRTDTNNPVPLPINFKRRDCQDDVGCEELFDGENVHISPTRQEGKVSIYRFNGPTYQPNII
jgi:hypothetical protein